MFVILGEAGIGSIEAGSNQQERLEEFTERVASGEFHRDITSGITIPVRCVDGRVPLAGANPLAPNSAGGTESIFVADDLTTKRFAGEHDSTLEGYGNTIKALRSAGFEVGGHSGQALKDCSGCGANDKLGLIYKDIAERGSIMRQLAAQLGVDVSDETHQLITSRAAERTTFSSGAELLSVLEANANQDYIDRLAGEHCEVMAVINSRPGTTLDRDALISEFGEQYQAFNVDVWALREAAKATSLTPEEEKQKFAAVVYYNIATTTVLSGKAMRIVTL